MSDGFFPLRAIASLYCECGHHRDVHKPKCDAVGADGKWCPCNDFHKRSVPKEPPK